VSPRALARLNPVSRETAEDPPKADPQAPPAASTGGVQVIPRERPGHAGSMTGPSSLVGSHDPRFWHTNGTLPTLFSTTRSQGASIVTTLPAEVVRRLGIPAGQRLDWIEDGLGGFRVIPHSEELGEASEAHEAIMAEYDGVFRELAK
jgi:hypothetical protein